MSHSGKTTSAPPPTSLSLMARPSAWSAGRNRPAIPRQRSPLRSPGLRRLRPSQPIRATRSGRAVPGHRRRLPAQRQRVDGDDHWPRRPRYFIRLSKTGDPNAAISYSLGNGGPTVDQRSVSMAGFQELVRLGELPVTDPDVQASLAVIDHQISVSTPSGTGYYRYGTSAAEGSADGYGDCYQPSQTSCTTVGAPWAPTGTGTGHFGPTCPERGRNPTSTPEARAVRVPPGSDAQLLFRGGAGTGAGMGGPGLAGFTIWE